MTGGQCVYDSRDEPECSGGRRPADPRRRRGNPRLHPLAARWQLEDAFGATRGPGHAQVGTTQLRCQQNTDAGSASSRQRLYPAPPRGRHCDWLSSAWSRPQNAIQSPLPARSRPRPLGQPRRGWRVILLLPDLGWCAHVSRPAAHFNFRFSWVSRGARLWTRGTWATGAIRTEGRTPGSPRVPRGENGAGCARALCPRAPAPGTREREFPPSAQFSLPGHGSPPLHVGWEFCSKNECVCC